MENQNAQLAKMPLASYKNVWEYLQTLEYQDEEGIRFLEEQLYNLLQALPEDSNLLALLMHEQIMNDRGSRARSIAGKIWETGGALAPEIEVMYIDDLINLGLDDMAGAALAPYISDLENSLKSHGRLLLKYALFSGKMTLLERLMAYLPTNRDNDILRSLLAMFDELKVSRHIPAIMVRLQNNLRDSVMGFSFNIFEDREFPEVEFVFYVDSSVTDYANLRENLNHQISAYCAAHKIEDLINLSTVVYPLSRHPRQELWMARP